MCSFEVLLFAEVTQKYNLKDSTFRKAIATGELLENIDCKEFGCD
ncbi:MULTISPECIES: hypothetical protein [unclassified Romboutsia]|nr:MULTISPECIES: hypothetical protein [unclassified Romboutsia]